MNVKEIRAMTGLSQSDFATKYKIPVSSLQNWEIGARKPPKYFVDLLEKAVQDDSQKDKLIKWLNPETAYEMGYVYNGLIYATNGGKHDPYPHADITPFKYIVLMHLKATRCGRIDDDLQQRLLYLMDVLDSNDMDEMMHAPSPMELRQYWQRGYLDYKWEYERKHREPTTNNEYKEDVPY